MVTVVARDFNFENNFILSQLKVTLPAVVKDHDDLWKLKMLENLSTNEDIEPAPPVPIHSRRKRDAGHPAMMMKKTKKVRTCQNMSGVLGGANAFNFLSFVSGVITLVVNVNNNVNNNNNNLNGISANANNNQNNNANVNNNAANIIIAMPGRKRRKRSDPLKTYFGGFGKKSGGCLEREPPSEVVSFPLVLMKAMQDFVKKIEEERNCSEKFCGSTKSIQEFLRSWTEKDADDKATFSV